MMNMMVGIMLLLFIFELIIRGMNIISSMSNRMKIIRIKVKFMDKLILKLLELLNPDSSLFMKFLMLMNLFHIFVNDLINRRVIDIEAIIYMVN